MSTTWLESSLITLLDLGKPKPNQDSVAITGITLSTAKDILSFIASLVPEIKTPISIELLVDGSIHMISSTGGFDLSIDVGPTGDLAYFLDCPSVNNHVGSSGASRDDIEDIIRFVLWA